MKLRSKYILVLLLALSFKAAWAQSDKVEALRVAFITEKVKLTPAEGQSFWPLYNEYNDKVKNLRENFKVNYGSKTEFKSDKEADDFLNAETKLKQSEVDLLKEYTEKFKKVLGSKKTAMLHKAEEAFKRKMIESLKGNGP